MNQQDDVKTCKNDIKKYELANKFLELQILQQQIQTVSQQLCMQQYKQQIESIQQNLQLLKLQEQNSQLDLLHVKQLQDIQTIKEECESVQMQLLYYSNPQFEEAEILYQIKQNREQIEKLSLQKIENDRVIFEEIQNENKRQQYIDDVIKLKKELQQEEERNQTLQQEYIESFIKQSSTENVHRQLKLSTLQKQLDIDKDLIDLSKLNKYQYQSINTNLYSFLNSTIGNKAAEYIIPRESVAPITNAPNRKTPLEDQVVRTTPHEIQENEQMEQK